MENVNAIQGQWAEICTQLTQTLSDRFAMRFLSKIIPDKIENNCVNLMVSSPCVREVIKQNYIESILSLWKTKNPGISAINLELAEPEQLPVIKQEIVQPVPAPSVSLPESDNTDSQTDEIPCYLDKTHTFDTFVVGKSNQFACAAAKQIAEADVPPFNPLYFHAGSGLGKTHLLHAIAWRMKERHPEKTILYLSSEQFFQRCMHDLGTTNKDAFITMVRSVDVLLIDDIQFILGKPWTQEVFFHTFNNLIAQNKTVILAADSAPSELHGISDKLRTRICQGLVVDITPAEEELRLGILQGKAKQIGVEIPQDVLSFLAKNITSNVRELEGALKRIAAHSTLLNTPINMETTRLVLKDILHTYDRPVKVPEIQQFVAAYYHISLNDLKSTRRDRAIARPRQIAMYLTKALTSLALPDIALCFNRDHTTIIHAVRTIEGLMQQDKKLSEQIADITAKLKAGMNA
ncbi:MAG: chromosomal replication initiator protein DnaA [Alphaproteobacteria bacterium]|nr:chromosomal replication initiator protein DnaA [Alphaproteobacteria bacterium]